MEAHLFNAQQPADSLTMEGCETSWPFRPFQTYLNLRDPWCVSCGSAGLAVFFNEAVTEKSDRSCSDLRRVSAEQNEVYLCSWSSVNTPAYVYICKAKILSQKGWKAKQGLPWSMDPYSQQCQSVNLEHLSADYADSACSPSCWSLRKYCWYQMINLRSLRHSGQCFVQILCNILWRGRRGLKCYRNIYIQRYERGNRTPSAALKLYLTLDFQSVWERQTRAPQRQCRWCRQRHIHR